MGWKDRATPVTEAPAQKSSWKNRAEVIEQDDSIMDNVIAGVVKVGRFVDSYTGAPARSAIGAAQEGKNPLSAFVGQIGQNPDMAPTGKNIVMKAGVPDEPFAKFTTQDVLDKARLVPGLSSIAQIGGALLPKSAREAEFQPSPADVAGFGIEVGADPTNLIPAVGAAKALGKGSVTAAQKIAAQAGRGAAVASEAVLPEKIFNTASSTVNAAKSALEQIFKPKRADDFAEFFKIAKKNGIDPNILPESIEFGPSSVISRGSRALREGPAGQPDMDRFEDAYFKVQEAAEKRLHNFSGGPPLTEVEAGSVIRKGYDDAVERLFNDVDFTYNEVLKQVPGIALTDGSKARISSKLNGLEKWAKGRLTRGITNTVRGQAEQVLRAVQAVKAANGSLKQTYEAMREIGEVAFKTSNSLADVPTDTQKFRDLYFTLRDEFIETTAERLGPDIAQSLIDNNAIITNFVSDKNQVAKIIGNTQMSPEKVFNSLVKNGDTNKINALKNILSPEQFKQLKGTFLDSLIKRNPDGTIAFGNLFTAMQNKKNVLAEIFEPQEIADYAELVKLGNRFGPSVLSTSGTGASNIFSNILEGIQSTVANRAVIDAMKNSARGRSPINPPLRAGGRSPINPPLRADSILPPSKYRQLNTRTGYDNALKYLQVLAAPSVSGEQESAAQRRLKEVARKKLGQ